MKEKIKQKGFIQIPLLIGIIVAAVIASAVGTGLILHRQGKLDFQPTDIPETYIEPQGIIVEEDLTEHQVEEKPEDISEQEETDFISPTEITEKYVIDNGPVDGVAGSNYLKDEIAEALAKIEKLNKDAEELKKLLQAEVERQRLQKLAEENSVVEKEDEQTDDLTIEQIIEDYLIKREKQKEEEKEIERIKGELDKREGLKYSIGKDKFNIIYSTNLFFINHTEIINEDESELEILQRIFNFVLEKEKEWNYKVEEMKKECNSKGNGWVWENNQCIQKPKPYCLDGKTPVWYNLQWHCPLPHCSPNSLCPAPA